ncbi:hypothetical protein JCM14469_40800 [Desulfatiferula olefinivorans]
MKQPDYRLIVLLIIFTVSTAIAVKLGHDPSKGSKAALIVNDTAISEQTFNRLFSKKPCLQSMDDFIHSVVVKEVLIQEGMKTGVHHEEAFRRSVRNFYEQSLIKIVMDRKYNALSPDIDPSMVERYVGLLGSTVDLTLMTYAGTDDVDADRTLSSEPVQIPFNRLSIEVRCALLELNPGDRSSPSYSEADNVYSVFRLDRIHRSGPSVVTRDDRDLALQLITEHQKERMITDWLDDLTSRASVTVDADVGAALPSRGINRRP